MQPDIVDAVRHKQACADRMHEILEQQHIVQRQIQRSKWDWEAKSGLPWQMTPEHRQRLSELIDELDRATAAYFEAAKVCDVPVFTKPFADPPVY